MKPKQPIYLRFGDWPEDERSTNYITKQKELGVSVVPTHYDAALGSWLYDLYDGQGGNRDNEERSLLYSSWLLEQRPAYLVTGEEVGRGSGGEPVLRSVQIVGYLILVFDNFSLVPRLASISKVAWETLQALRGNYPTITLMRGTV